MSCFGRKTRKCRRSVNPIKSEVKKENILRESSNSQRKRRKRETAELKAKLSKIKRAVKILKNKESKGTLTSQERKTLHKIYTMNKATSNAIQKFKTLQRTAKSRKTKLERQRSRKIRQRKTRRRKRNEEFKRSYTT